MRACLAILVYSVLQTSALSIQTYYPTYNAQLLEPDAIPYSKLDDISYFVVEPQQDGSLSPVNTTLASQIVSKAKAANATVTLVIGGWTGSRYFSSLVGNPSSRTTLVSNLMEVIQKNGFDGVQVDWESPAQQAIGCNQVNEQDDVPNLLTFLQAMRTALGAQKRLSVAVGTGLFANSNAAMIAKFAPVVSDLMIMAYDLGGPWLTSTAPNAPLRTCAASIVDASVDSAISTWTKAGIPAQKLILGLAAYGYGYQQVSSLKTTVKSAFKTQVYQSFKGVSAGGSTADPAGVDICGNKSAGGGQYLFRDLINGGKLDATGLKGAGGYQRYWDACSSTPFLYSASKQELITYDDPQSIAAKVAYAQKLNLLSVAFFDATGDKGTLLLDAARSAMQATPASNKSQQKPLLARHPLVGISKARAGRLAQRAHL